MKKELKKTKLVIFDMDGLMFNTERRYADDAVALAKLRNIRIDIQALYDVIGTSLPLDFDRMDIDHVGVEAIKDLMHTSHELAVKDMVENGVPAMKGLYNLLDILEENNIIFCVGTSTRKEISKPLLISGKVYDRLSFMTTKQEVENGKPAPDIFLKCCEKANVKPNEALVLEDTNNGCRAALNGNIPYIMIPDIQTPEEDIKENAISVAKDLDEVAEMFK